jgi:hypothetical protein
MVFRNFCYETIIEAQLGSKFREIRVETGIHRLGEINVAGKILYSWVRWAFDLCRERTNHVHWCFKMLAGGEEVAYNISMRSKESALESFRCSEKSALDTGDTLLQRAHKDTEEALIAYFIHCEKEGHRY